LHHYADGRRCPWAEGQGGGHLAIVPTLLRGGERFFEHLGGGPALYECVAFVNSGTVAHARLVRVAD
jgi:hypothetical protein